MKWLVGIWWLVAVAAWAAQPPFDARVVRVVDGDSLWVKALTHAAPLRLRLQGLDAPEACQAYGPQAREALGARLALSGQRVTVSLLHRDSYDRWLARVVTADGDVGAWLVEQGLAWSDGGYARQEGRARRMRLGLFSQSQPERPRDFRRRHGPCEATWPSREQRGDRPVYPLIGAAGVGQTVSRAPLGRGPGDAA